MRYRILASIMPFLILVIAYDVVTEVNGVEVLGNNHYHYLKIHSKVVSLIVLFIARYYFTTDDEIRIEKQGIYFLSYYNIEVHVFT